jgi:hypothetical protein
MSITLSELRVVLEALKSAKAEIEAMEDTYHDYVAAGHLLEQIDEAIDLVKGGANNAN